MGRRQKGVELASERRHNKAMNKVSRKYWITFPTRREVERPIIWEMCRAFPDVIFDIRQASVQHEIGIMAILLEGEIAQVDGAVAFLQKSGVQVDPIEKSVVEG